jgi:hypothetical protein
MAQATSLNWPTPDPGALVKGAAKQLGMDEGLLERLAEEVRRTWGRSDSPQQRARGECAPPLPKGYSRTRRITEPAVRSAICCGLVRGHLTMVHWEVNSSITAFDLAADINPVG